MKDEQLNIYDKHRNLIGIASREDVHKLGHWHEIFSCWFISQEEETTYMYLQLRSNFKNDYPNLLDVTVAGHLVSDETPRDGIREIKEEIGIDISFEDLVPLGVVNYSMKKNNFIDKEIAHVFLYKVHNLFNMVNLQEEVSGIVKVEFKQFSQLWLDERKTVNITGFKLNKNGEKVPINEDVGKDKFLPYGIVFYKTIIKRIEVVIKQL